MSTAAVEPRVPSGSETPQGAPIWRLEGWETFEEARRRLGLAGKQGVHYLVFGAQEFDFDNDVRALGDRPTYLLRSTAIDEYLKKAAQFKEVQTANRRANVAADKLFRLQQEMRTAFRVAGIGKRQMRTKLVNEVLAEKFPGRSVASYWDDLTEDEYGAVRARLKGLADSVAQGNVDADAQG